MDSTAIIEAIDILKTRRAKALEQLKSMLSEPDSGAVLDTRKVSAQIVQLCDQAGVGPEFLQPYLKPRAPVVKRVHIGLGMNLTKGQGDRPYLWIDELTRGSGGSQIDMSKYLVEPGGEQTKAEVEELLRIITDFNARTPGKCDEGLRLLKKVDIGGGLASAIFGSEKAKKIVEKFSLWRIRQAVCEAILIKEREPKLTTPLDELFLCRIGLAGWIPPVVTGNGLPGIA